VSLGLPSCVLITTPVHIVSSVAEGTYSVGKKAVTATSDAYDRHEKKKEAEKAKAEQEEEKAKARQGKQAPAGGGSIFPDIPPTPAASPSGSLPQSDGQPVLPVSPQR